MAGCLLIPLNLCDQANATLVTLYPSGIADNLSNQQALLSTVVLNITLLDGQGNSITQLNSPLTICLALVKEPKKGEKLCLGFFDETKAKWRCEDECLTSVTKGNAKIDNLLCGQTGHLTNFALLVTGSDEVDPCEAGRNTLSWISLGMVGGAILVVAFCVVLVEFFIRWKHYQEVRKLALLAEKCKLNAL